VSVRRRLRKTFGGGRRGFALLTLAVVGVVIVAMGTIGVIGSQAGGAAGPVNPQRSATPTKPASPSPSSPKPLSLDASAPQELTIPAMHVHSHLQSLGKKDSKYIELPTPSRAGWYKKSAAPGELGVATVIGYIRKSSDKPGVFVHLNKLHKGDRISISRKDKATAIFRVDKIKSYTIKNFSADEVYGQTQRRAELRIITCGGTLKSGDPRGNVVVFAHLVDTAD
jgi:sortase (surface protein transpeptidase)